MYQSWINDLDKYLSYSDYFSKRSLLKLYVNPNDLNYSLLQWTKFIDSDVYNSTPHLQMLFSHEIKACDACVGKNAKNNNKTKTCSKCKNTKKVDAGYNSLYFPVYILNGDGSPIEDHLKIIKKSHKINYDYEKITFFDNKYIKVCKPMHTDIINIFQGQERVDYINKIVNYCRVRIPKDQKLTETFVENSQYIDSNNPKNYFLTSNDLVFENKKRKKNVEKDLNDSFFFDKKRKIIKKDINGVQNIDINNWLLYNDPKMSNILNQDINRHHKEWLDVKITTIRTPNKDEQLFIINVDNKYAKYCENVDRFHTCSNIYFVLNVNGLSQRCFSLNKNSNPATKCSNFHGQNFSYQTKYLAMFNTPETYLSNIMNKSTHNYINKELLKRFEIFKNSNNDKEVVDNANNFLNKPYKTLLQEIQIIKK